MQCSGTCLSDQLAGTVTSMNYPFWWQVTGYNLHMGDGDTFPLKDARKAAAALPLREYACAILLGLNVGRAFVQVEFYSPLSFCSMFG